VPIGKLPKAVADWNELASIAYWYAGVSRRRKYGYTTIISPKHFSFMSCKLSIHLLGLCDRNKRIVDTAIVIHYMYRVGAGGKSVKLLFQKAVYC